MRGHIGIVAVSAEGAALCYRTICHEGAAVFGRHNHPEITMHTLPLAAYMRLVEAGDWQGVGKMLLCSAEKVYRAGAECLICPDNTVHEGIDLVRDRPPVPWLHIAEEVATVAATHNYGSLLVLGTRYLMEGPVYRRKLEARGIEMRVPEADERNRINDAIFDELVNARFNDTTRAEFSRIIDNGKAAGADAVVLGCTEIPLLIQSSDSVLPILDSTRILARAALRRVERE
jgi:aspartate racemase